MALAQELDDAKTRLGRVQVPSEAHEWSLVAGCFKHDLSDPSRRWYRR